MKSKPDPVGIVGLVAVLVLVVAAGTFRMGPVDIPWHLATGRLIVEEGVFPVTNTFSWTWPDHPLYQQYPLFQAGLWLIVDKLGWPALSLANCAAWTAAFLLWMRAAGPWQRATEHPMLWLLVAVGVQRHLVARPEALTLCSIGAMLVAFEAYRRGRTGALVVVVLAQWGMVLSHQLFPLGLALQGLLLVHVLVARHLADRLPLAGDDADLPIRPLMVTLAASVAVLAVSPLGFGVYLVPFETLNTVLSQGQGTSGGAQAQELAPVWTDPIATFVVVVGLAVVAACLWRTRGRWQLLDLGIFGMGLLMVAMAVRGIPFFALGTGVLVTRASAGSDIPTDAPIRRAAAASAGALALLLAWMLWQDGAAYMRVQRGLGRSHGEWADHMVAFLNESPPPGPLMNIGWVVGNPLIWGVPDQPVFVDPRWEAYPKPFLLEAIRSMKEPEVLEKLLDEHQPNTIVAEMRLPEVQARVGELVRGGDWALVHVDTLMVVLVREGANPAYLAAHRLEVDAIDPPDWLPEHPLLHAQQQVRMARLYRELGQSATAEALIEAAREQADHPAVAMDLATLDED